MKKRQMSIEEYKSSSGAYIIIINNARYQRNFFNAIKKIMEVFLTDKEVFLGFCRTDGMNLRLAQQKTLKNDIPAFFQRNGDFESLNEYLSIARIELNNYSYGIIPLVFDYYLETLVFNPKVNWETFKKYHLNYQEHRFDDIILNHFAEILFYYFDSGDFLICFNPKMYNPTDVRNLIKYLG